MKQAIVLTTFMIAVALPVAAEDVTSIDLKEFVRGGAHPVASMPVSLGNPAEDQPAGEYAATPVPVFPQGYLELNALTQQHVAEIAADIDSTAQNYARCQLVMKMAALAGLPVPRLCTEGD